MYPVQASLKELQFLNNRSTEVPEKSFIDNRSISNEKESLRDYSRKALLLAHR
jgi:hypothetical protein